MPATQWPLQVLPLRNPLLRVTCACWPTPPQREAGTKQHEDSMHEELPASQKARRAISRSFGDTRESMKSIRTSAATESLLTPLGGTGILCEFWKPEISREMHSMIATVIVNNTLKRVSEYRCVLFFNCRTFSFVIFKSSN